MNARRGITETQLKDWRYGQTQAERLCAGILSVEEFKSVDPQSPLGGRDGIKDVLCSRDGKKYIAAVFFPTTTPTIKEILRKLEKDIKGVRKNNVQGIIFFVNQHLTVGQRNLLEQIARNVQTEAHIYHLERLRNVLDSPKGYGLRQQYLQIEMTKAELIAAASIWQDNLKNAISSHPSTKILATQMFQTQSMLISLAANHYENVSYKKAYKDSVIRNMGTQEIPITSNLTINLVLFIHKIIINNNQPWAGKIRSVQTWVAKGNYPITKAIYVPPLASRVPELLKKLLNNWNLKYALINKSSIGDKVSAIALFHIEFLTIHPVTDGNGRIARLIMNQQIEDLLGLKTDIDFHRAREKYFQALQKGQSGNEKELTSLLLAELNQVIRYKRVNKSPKK